MLAQIGIVIMGVILIGFMLWLIWFDKTSQKLGDIMNIEFEKMLANKPNRFDETKEDYFNLMDRL